jgi:hypothetical protein
MRIPTLPLLLALTALHPTQPLRAQHEEAGPVLWGRDLDQSLIASGKTGKPVFALFQEIPGCSGCKQFGREVLSHPLVAEAVQNEFTPLLIYNNKGGKDAAVLQRFGEPAWNYQVVRFLDSESRDILPRKAQVWDIGGIASRMVASLEASQRQVPNYLRLLSLEHSAELKTAAFSMHCFWTGEVKLGQIPGVITTEAGFLAGREVTRVQYAPSLISLPDLITAAESVDCAHSVHLPDADLPAARSNRLTVTALTGYSAAPVSDQKRQLTGTPLQKLKLTAAQATKVNAWVRQENSTALSYLSPAQRSLLR